MLFILIYLILFLIVHITMSFVCVLRVVMCMGLFLAIIVYIIIVIITTILIFFNTTSHWGRIQQLNSSGMIYPYPLITLGKSQGIIFILFYFFCKLFFGDRC